MQIEGTVDVAFTNRSSQTVREAVLFLFPTASRSTRTSTISYRQYLYPDKDFDPGAMQPGVREARPSASQRRWSGLTAARRGQRACWIADLAARRHAAARRCAIASTAVPHRFGSFGEFDGQLTLVGGWYPYLADAAHEAASGISTRRPGLADFDVTLSATYGLA